MGRTWEDNADELARMDDGEGWPFARLVACSVEPGQGGPTVARATVKATANQFAKRWGTAATRVMRYLRGWQLAAEAGLVIPANELTPDDVNTPYPTEAKNSWLLKNREFRFREKPVEKAEQQPESTTSPPPPSTEPSKSNNSTGKSKGGYNGSSDRVDSLPDHVKTRASSLSKRQLKKVKDAAESELAARRKPKQTDVEKTDERLNRERINPEGVAAGHVREASRLMRSARDSLAAALGKLNDATALGIELPELPFVSLNLTEIERDVFAVQSTASAVLTYVQTGSVSGQAEEWLAQQDQEGS